MKKFVKSYLEYIKEDSGGGVAYATAGGATGMGAIISPGGNTIPGVPGAAGSGDFGSSFLPTNALKNTIYKQVDTNKQLNDFKKMTKRKKEVDKEFKNKKPKKKNSVENFSDFIKKFK